jgi:hypothetical protein
MTIRIVHTPKNKPNGKYCPWMVDVGVDVVEKK